MADLEPSITLRFGVLSYLVKPFDLTAVREALKTAVDWHDQAVASGTRDVEHARLEEWLNSLEML